MSRPFFVVDRSYITHVNERTFDIETKLIGLLRLSESKVGGTEHEAKLALETAIRLAAKHGIKLSSLTEKRNEFSNTNTWFRGGSESAPVGEDYVAPEFVQVARWCKFAEDNGWTRFRRTYDKKEGMIYAYRVPDRVPKLELRIFDRPWGDVEFEVVRNPDPIIGQFESWMNNIFDVIHLGVTFSDYRDWVNMNARALPTTSPLNTGA